MFELFSNRQNYYDYAKNMNDDEKMIDVETQGFLYMQNVMKDVLQNNEDRTKKFFIGRLSGNEPNLVGRVLAKQLIPHRLIYEMCVTAGIKFNNTRDIIKYVEDYTNAVRNSTHLGVWNRYM